jgi:DNA-binding NtrC family response regulator
MTPDSPDAALDAALPELLGTSPPMRELLALVRQVAPYASTVLITGETGSGKELVARALHRLGPRAGRAFVAVNCSAIVETLFESELFGHVRGAFTGATEHRIGLVERAHGGTLLLDEIGELSPAMQAKLLRVLETGEVTRVGATDPRRFDVHVVAATNRDLARDAVVGRFRSDLFYRLNIVDIRVPSLRERPGDVWLLANTFVRQAATRFGRPVTGLSEEAAPVLAAWDWPGNVRELRNTIERAVMLAIGPLVTCADLRCGAARATDVPSPSRPGLRVVRRIDDLEREAIAQALADTRGNKKEAARRLGISRRALYRRIEKFGLDRVARAA